MRPFTLVLAVAILAVAGAAIHAVGIPIDWAQAPPDAVSTPGTTHAELGRVEFNGTWVYAAIVHYRNLPKQAQDRKVYFLETDLVSGYSGGDAVVAVVVQPCPYCP